MKKYLFMSFVVGLVLGCNSGGGGGGGGVISAAIADVGQRLTGMYDGPYELIVENLSAGSGAITELRALNDVGCAMDLGTTGSNWSADISLQSNEAFVVSESTCRSMAIKHNSDGDIRFSVGSNPQEVATLNYLGQFTLREGDCTSSPPATGIALCVKGGQLLAVKPDGLVTVLVQ